MKRWITFGAIGIVIAAALTGCSASGSGSSGTTTINYWGYSEGVTGVTAKKVIAEFEKSHPNYKVNGVVLSVSDFDTKLPTALGKSSGPDLVYTGTEPTSLGRYVQAGQVLSLKSVWNKRGWNKQLPSTQARVTYNGQPYAVGNEVESVGLLYNEKLFQKLGLTVPTSLDELESDMKTIQQKDPSVTPMDLACGGPCYSGLHMMHALGYATMKTKEVLGTTPGGTDNYSDSSWLKTLDLFQQWNKDGYFTKNASGIPDANHLTAFCTGKTAMVADGPWEFATLSACEKQDPSVFQYGYASFPVKSGLPDQAYVGTGKAWFLSDDLKSDPAKEKAVLDLVSMMTAKSTFKSWIEKDQLIPAFSFNSADYSLTQPQKDMLTSMAKAGKNGGAVDIGFNNSAADTNIWTSGLQGILSGSVAPKQLLSNLQSQLETDRSAWKAAK